REAERCLVNRNVGARRAARLVRGDDHVLELEDEELLLRLPRPTRREYGLLVVLARGAAEHELRRGLAHDHRDNEILHLHFPRSATAASRRCTARTGLAPAERLELDLALVLQVGGLPRHTVDLQEVVDCHDPPRRVRADGSERPRRGSATITTSVAGSTVFTALAAREHGRTRALHTRTARASGERALQGRSVGGRPVGREHELD